MKIKNFRVTKYVLESDVLEVRSSGVVAEYAAHIPPVAYYMSNFNGFLQYFSVGKIV